jgi:hypothetical protein
VQSSEKRARNVPFVAKNASGATIGDGTRLVLPPFLYQFKCDKVRDGRREKETKFQRKLARLPYATGAMEAEKVIVSVRQFNSRCGPSLGRSAWASMRRLTAGAAKRFSALRGKIRCEPGRPARTLNKLSNPAHAFEHRRTVPPGVASRRPLGVLAGATGTTHAHTESDAGRGEEPISER